MRAFIVKSLHDIFKDDFNEGAHVNYFDIETKQQAETYQAAVIKHLSELGYDMEVEDLEIDEESNTLQTSCTVDADNRRPDQSTVEAWKKGKASLYAARITISVFELTLVKL